MRGTIELQTERLRLRRHAMEDAEILYEKFGLDPVMYQYSGWNPYVTEEMARDTIQGFINDHESHSYSWAIEYNGALIGTIGAYDYDEEKKQIEIGFSIERSSWGKGFATEALVCVLRYLTEEENIENVVAWCASDNIGSMKAMHKAGMKQTSIEEHGLSVGNIKFDKLNFSYQR